VFVEKDLKNHEFQEISTCERRQEGPLPATAKPPFLRNAFYAFYRNLVLCLNTIHPLVGFCFSRRMYLFDNKIKKLADALPFRDLTAQPSAANQLRTTRRRRNAPLFLARLRAGGPIFFPSPPRNPYR
jgi:hypothetical protein